MSEEDKSNNSKENEVNEEENEEGENEDEDNEEESEGQGKEEENEEENEEEESVEDQDDEKGQNKSEKTNKAININQPNTLKQDKPQESNFNFVSHNQYQIIENLLSILKEISTEMDNLTIEIQNQFSNQPVSNNPLPISSTFIPVNEPKPIYNNDKNEISQLLLQAEQLSKAIDSELIKDNYLLEDKQQSNKNNNFNNKKEELNQQFQPQLQTQILPQQEQQQRQQYHQEIIENKPYMPYDPNKYRDYYESLNDNRYNKSLDYQSYSHTTKENKSNNDNPFAINNSTSTQNMNRSRVIKNDDIYLGNNARMNSLPIIYSQHSNEIGSSIESFYNNNDLNDEFLRKQSSLLPYNNSREYYSNQSLRSNKERKREENPFEKNK